MKSFFRITLFFLYFFCYKFSYGFISAKDCDLDTLRNNSRHNISSPLISANLEKVINSKKVHLRVCEDSKLVLKAPKNYLNQIVFWECPDGQKVYSGTLLIDQVSTRNSGVYKLRIISEDDDFEGDIMVDVVENNNNFSQNLRFCEGERILLNASQLGQFSNVTWLNHEYETISNSNLLELTNHPVGAYNYYLKAIKNGCEITSNLKVSISKKPQLFMHINEFSKNKLQLQIIGDIQNALFKWVGDTVQTENKSSLLIERPKKGIHEFRCKIIQDSCEVIANASFEITE